MNTFTECDRCGKQIVKPTSEDGNYVIWHAEKYGDYSARFDLCPKCMESLDRWIKGVIE